MGRGGAGGGHSSGGGHSHSSGSHGSSHSHSSVGGGRSRSSFSRGGRSSRNYSLGPSFGSGYHRSTPPIIHNHCGGYGYNSYDGGYRRSSLFSMVLTMVILLVMFAMIAWGTVGKSKSGITASTTQRTKVESGNAFISDCVEDEIGWIRNPNKVASGLKKFYEKTGCQPYIILKKYDASLMSSEASEAWSKEYYDTHFKENQNVVLYTYFCDEYDEGNGIDTLFVGTQSGLVFDAEAQEIFWNTLDYNWDTWDTNDNDGMFVDTFTKTGDRIMTVTTTANDVKRTVAIVIGVLGVGVILIILVAKKFKRDKEKAAETERILNAPIDTLGGQSGSDDLADRYTNK